MNLAPEMREDDWEVEGWDEVGARAHTHTPVLEERVISEVAQPGVPDGLPQLMMVPG